MKGSVVEVEGSRGSRWELFVSAGKDAAGQRIRMHKRFSGTKGQADRALRDLIHEIEAGTYVKPTATTLAQFLEGKWFQVKAGTVRPQTLATDRDYARWYIVPRVGGVSLPKLSAEVVQNLYSELQAHGGRGGRPLAPGTVLKVHNILNGAMEQAVRFGLVARNVVESAVPPRQRRREIKSLTSIEANRVLEQLRKASPWAFAPTYLAFHTGARRCEILGLKWGDVDLAKGSITIVRGYHRLDDGRGDVQPPKTARGRRLIPLTTSSFEVLRAHRAEAERVAAMLGRAVSPDDVVFARFDGEPYRPDSLSQAYRRAARREAMRASFHGSRHSHATLGMQAGIHPKVMSERLGHASVLITLDTYSHVMPGLQEAASESLEKVLGTRPALPASA
ncbi:MAG: site-specific integrase [Chloroflexi bacterium]|nr:site-specific integrase [Chloroflexota bacterium]